MYSRRAFKLRGEYCLYILGIHRSEASTTKEVNLESRAQYINVVSNEIEQFLLSSSPEASGNYVHTERHPNW